jgi:hypothetical protein
MRLNAARTEGEATAVPGGKSRKGNEISPGTLSGSGRNPGRSRAGVLEAVTTPEQTGVGIRSSGDATNRWHTTVPPRRRREPEGTRMELTVKITPRVAAQVARRLRLAASVRSRSMSAMASDALDEALPSLEEIRMQLVLPAAEAAAAGLLPAGPGDLGDARGQRRDLASVPLAEVSQLASSVAAEIGYSPGTARRELARYVRGLQAASAESQSTPDKEREAER